MAITADVLQAVAVNPAQPGTPSKVRIANVNTERFASRDFTIPPSGDVDIDATQSEWSNYFKAGLKGATSVLRQRRDFQHVSMDILVDGTVPAGGGLSSSAAFVCASALATLRANGERDINKKELVECAIVSERAVGVNSGGLDQSASVFALRDSGMLVTFKPSLSATNVSFPTGAAPGKDLVFLIAQSLVAADKHVTGPIHYNLRVVECTLAALFLSRVFGLKRPLPDDSAPLGISLRGFHDTYFEEKEGVANNHAIDNVTFAQQLETLIQLTGDYVTQDEGYTRQQLSEVLGLSVAELEQRYMTQVPVRAERFQLRKRALHVFSEALRVQKFMDALQAGGSADATIKELAALVNATQESCRDLYECSCPELDELCEIALRNGGYGSRLTGAGWGGCSVHLVPEDRVDKVKAAWKADYYDKKFPGMSAEKLDEAIVVTRPGRGSLVYAVEGRSEV